MIIIQPNNKYRPQKGTLNSAGSKVKLEVHVALCNEYMEEVTYSSSPLRNVICRRKKPAKMPGSQQLIPNGVFPH
jgi:hypothetical protein